MPLDTPTDQNIRITQIAQAKVNLALHITGLRADGYHLLDSLVVFPAFGDRITCTIEDEFALSISGEFAAPLQGDIAENLVLTAAKRLRQALGTTKAAHINLQKNLPVAAGIGGGSADAAAALVALQQLWGQTLPAQQLHHLATSLGADVPMCLAGAPVRTQGIGDELSPVPFMPKGMAIVLANPRRPVSTPAIFTRLKKRENPPLPSMPDTFKDAQELATWLHTTRNDLQETAVALEPSIGQALQALADQPQTLFARMSGSGATCFALCENIKAAEALAQNLQRMLPSHWICASAL
ncbi:4-(cytidine 5'-diphospho)-2-C-methyl-D-erythritol kinase [Polycladidibacter hongkongensis]|uniref:4-(cytidine 5'-diphospho)-2-C-methyl-D-erythritol kinase n=1 Tax=Polycladidibacter hongkongensis TaxID=1647556 RepID=UPI000829B339|nr:4-(cytidine 5'-diphospho)-2-C-methyl-D-erythritol kinase [Pseudovibrio hongkongensis]